jgi:hypothetical protein
LREAIVSALSSSNLAESTHEPPQWETPSHEVIPRSDWPQEWEKLYRESFPQPQPSRAKNPKCNLHFHLKGSLSAVYQRACRLSHNNGGEFYEGDTSAAKRVLPYCRGTLGRAKKKLVQEGWLVLIKSNKEYGREGDYLPNRYRVVSHDEWAGNHPHQCRGDAQDRATKPHTVSGQDRATFPHTVPCNKTAHNVLSDSKACSEPEKSKACFESTSTSTSEQKKKNDHHEAPAQEDAGAGQIQNHPPACSDVDVDEKQNPKAAIRERQKSTWKSPWDIDDAIAWSVANWPEDDPDKLFCWHVFGGRFQYQNGFKNDPEGDKVGFMEVARECYEYAKRNWTWDGDDVKVNTNQTVDLAYPPADGKLPPYASIKGIVRFMTLVADRLAKGNGDGFQISAKCFFAALAQAREERNEVVKEHLERQRRGY